MTIIDIYKRYGVPFRVVGSRGGWIDTHCCFCSGSADFHLGYSIEQKFYKCWRCGFHQTIDTLEVLCHIPRDVAIELYKSLDRNDGSNRPLIANSREANARVTISRYHRPSDVGPLRPSHRSYLERRGFDPDEIEREWGVLSTGPMSYLDEISYRHRLLIPVRWDGVEVSFQARDVTDRADRKYMACPPEREAKSHKHLLYGQQECWGETGIIVEGVTDVWRLGSKACAVFGIQYRAEQVREIARHFRRAMIVFDSEWQAKRQAEKLADQLRVRLPEGATVVDLSRMGIDAADPGSMSQDDADHLMRELIR